MVSKELVQLREVNIILLVTLEKLALSKDADVSLLATEALRQVKRLQNGLYGNDSTAYRN